jgi:hypothetical protein
MGFVFKAELLDLEEESVKAFGSFDTPVTLY